ncbi:MAG: type VI secretion system baseplate subunit TssF [Bacteroidetes bacterium]|nr:type VI secretion system baseplate subunit TssF [Bacteroidota bacterium]
MLPFSKEAINHRMTTNALSFWGLKNNDELDPVVKLMIEALSASLYELSTESQNAQVRMLDRVAQLLTPDYVVAPRPASGLMHAISIEPTDVLLPSHQFSCSHTPRTETSQKPEKPIELWFSPARPIRIANYSIGAIITSNYAFALDERQQRINSVTCNIPELKIKNAVWIGIQSPVEKLPIQNLSLHFQFSRIAPQEASQALSFLPLVKCFYDNAEISMNEGLCYEASKEDISKRYASPTSTMRQIEEDVVLQYNRYFLSFNSDLVLTADKRKPLPIEGFAQENQALSSLGLQPMHWILLTFPHTIHSNLLDNCDIQTNVFPCINRRLIELQHSLKGGSKIVPLKNKESHEQYLEIATVGDSSQNYQPPQYGYSTDEPTGLYNILQEGLERFDSRDATTHLTNLLQLLRAESASFAAYGYDFVASSLKELHQKIAMMEQKISSSPNNANSNNHYLLVQPIQGEETIFASYWATSGSLANGIKSSFPLKPNNNHNTQIGSTYFIQQTNGGSNRLLGDNRLAAFRYALLSRDTIVTKQDILSFCEKELGESVHKIEISTIQVAEGRTVQHFRRVVQVLLTPRIPVNEEDWLQTCDRLQAQLKSRSGMTMNYRVQIVA